MRGIGDAGVMSNPDTRGKGYAYESLRVVFDYGLEVLGHDEVRVEVQAGNMAVREMIERRFEVEGRGLMG